LLSRKFFINYFVILSFDSIKNYINLLSVTRKVAQYLSEVLEHEKDKLAENLMANNGKFFN
jgi:hypothetical protein